MRTNSLIQLAAGIAVGLLSLTAMAAPAGETSLKSAKDMILDPEGFVHVADDGVARSYAANGTVIDYAPLSNIQLAKMVNDLPAGSRAEMKHLAEVFAAVDGFAVKDRHQIFHPSTQLRPAINPTKTHWNDESSANEAREAKAALEDSVATLTKRGNHEGKPAACQESLCANNAVCAPIGCPGKSCWRVSHFWPKNCHDLNW